MNLVILVSDVLVTLVNQAHEVRTELPANEDYQANLAHLAHR